MRVLSILGTRPEVIKLAPVIKELGHFSRGIELRVCVTGQHREILDQMMRAFKIEPDLDLDLMAENQSLPNLTSKLLSSLGEVIQSEKPDILLLQGDTTTVMAASLAAFYLGIPVGHIEAGLRSGCRRRPFPEEMNRRVTSLLTELHFAPTKRAKDTLLAEGIPENRVYLTGNTVIDALKWILASSRESTALDFLGKERSQLLLVTAHRRESFGKPIEQICEAIQTLSSRNPDLETVYPVHPNPNVRSTVFQFLQDKRGVHLIDPLSYTDFVQLMNRSDVILTDSGGIQEEAPFLGKPVLVLRDQTERLEGIELGTARLVGTNPDKIVQEVERLFRDPAAYQEMSSIGSPYGDGKAAKRIVNILLQRFASR